MTSSVSFIPEERLADVLRFAKAKGATEAVACLALSESAEASVRGGSVETLTQSFSRSMTLRAFVGKQAAALASSDMEEAPERFAERAVETARSMPEDPYAVTADAGLFPSSAPDLGTDDGACLSVPELVERALSAEAAALAEKGISKSEGAEASASRVRIFWMRTDGCGGDYSRSSYGNSVCVIAGGEDGAAMERDYAYRTVSRYDALPDPREIGGEAARRTLRRLGASKPESGRYAIVFEPRAAAGMLGNFLAAASGSAVARNASFLQDMRDKPVFRDYVRIMHDPRRVGGLQSKPFDAEGVETRAFPLVEEGILRDWLLHVRSAAQLRLVSNGCAAGVGDPSPASANAYVAAGKASPAEMIASVERGIYVTDTFGGGANTVTGDYSQGVSGLLIEKGKLTHAVNEFTLAGDLKSMFARMEAANDLAFLYARNCPTLMIEDMAVAGT